jgi:hypothetical protein
VQGPHLLGVDQPASNDEITKHNSVSLHVPGLILEPQKSTAPGESIEVSSSARSNTHLERYNIYKTVFSGTSLETFNAKHDEFHESQPPPAPSTSNVEQQLQQGCWR